MRVATVVSKPHGSADSFSCNEYMGRIGIAEELYKGIVL